MYKLAGKRIFDVIFVIFSFIILSPVMLLVAVAIGIFDPGPIFFKHQRVGRKGELFDFYKFRSMPISTGILPSDKVGSVELTWIGKMIRRTNIDELPQLLNILKGDMSLVGPRPPIPSQIELVEARALNGALELRPGLTGLAQIRSFNGMTPQQKAKFDGVYATDISFINDLRIIIGTFTYMLRPPPVY